ncbi:hypothetical protein HYDPIDRAFT_83895 [Hydnomerulius pinastri MD-312]|nr:hypothetical protein HYDPIDRAFT_83895 [Hydnomerulius pinastri MD-312]
MIYALKHPSLFRPSSRPTSPSPTSSPHLDSAMGVDRARPHNRLSFNSFRRPSSLTPAASPSPAPLVQDGSYLEALSLKLSEAVSKALAQPTGPAAPNEMVGVKRPIPAGRGEALGLLIASELKATRDNAHLHRAILRSLHRPLSVLLSNLSALLLPLLSSPAFMQPLAPTVQAPTLNATQLHALAAANFAGELLSSFDNMALGLDNDARGDGLKPIREGLASLIGRVVNPLIGGIKSELMPLIEALENPVSVTVHKGATKAGLVLHPSIITLQSLMPIYARALARYTTALPSQATLATFLISVVWRALVALSHRRYILPSPPTSPPSSPQMMPALSKRQRASSGNTPPITPPAGRFTLKLPPSRPPSPPSIVVTSTAAADARALHELMLLLPRPPADSEATKVAREAVDEAFADLKALAPLLEAADNPFFNVNKSADEISVEIEGLTADLPTLIALPVLLRMQSLGRWSIGPAATVASIIDIPEDEYRKGCLAGFGRAEEYGLVVGQNVLHAIHAQPNLDPRNCLSSWLEARVGSPDH